MTVAEAIDFHGMPAVRWTSHDGASAIATLQGGQLVSWRPAGHGEALFLSERSAFEAGRAIRGGIPVCFPQFADRGPLLQHGFARTTRWNFLGASERGAESLAHFALESSRETAALWPASFRLELVAAIGAQRLEVRLVVTNSGDAPFHFTTALHTYLRVEDAATVRLRGLRGAAYLERGAAGTSVEAREYVTAEAPIDRIYFATPAATRLDDGERTVHIEQETFTDTVVWNPGRDRTARMADMAPDGYQRMLCVEAAAIQPAIALASGRSWTAAQALTLSSPA